MNCYTLVEHENLANFVVAAAVPPKLEARAKQHMGVIFDDYEKADTAANEINDWACVQALGVEPLYPNRVAHLTGFSSKCRVDGRRLYIPITTSDTAIKES
ncbi:hypothetical protein OG705_28980 [Streptomyces sp. NBC_00838]|uniref:hypothetical protein n=1 Tax=Streptomyces sp. NBC_00838 TaxID=2903680 RepID=UPI003869940C|nr:hypothetical protein OG705_28980 [Streptomyces sp. NBC_00838]